VQLKALFLGFTHKRVKRITSAIEAAVEEVSIAATVQKRPGARMTAQLEDAHAVFVSRDLEDDLLERTLETVRDRRSDIPIALIYDSEPDGKAFLLANKYDCQLFSELDRLGRTLAPWEIGELLLVRLAAAEIERRLMEISCCSGPCSTGD
jgi:hypothetical protein